MLESGSKTGTTGRDLLDIGEGWIIRGYSSDDDFASSFKQDGVTPNAVHLADLFPGADGAETGFFVELEAGGIFGEDPGLQGPEAVSLAFGDECL